MPKIIFSCSNKLPYWKIWLDQMWQKLPGMPVTCHCCNIALWALAIEEVLSLPTRDIHKYTVTTYLHDKDFIIAVNWDYLSYNELVWFFI